MPTYRCAGLSAQTAGCDGAPANPWNNITNDEVHDLRCALAEVSRDNILLSTQLSQTRDQYDLYFNAFTTQSRWITEVTTTSTQLEAENSALKDRTIDLERDLDVLHENQSEELIKMREELTVARYMHERASAELGQIRQQQDRQNEALGDIRQILAQVLGTWQEVRQEAQQAALPSLFDPARAHGSRPGSLEPPIGSERFGHRALTVQQMLSDDRGLRPAADGRSHAGGRVITDPTVTPMVA